MSHAPDSLEVDTYVVDTLMPDLVGHDRRPAAFLVYLFLSRTAGSRNEWHSISLTQIAEGTGLSKRTVQAALDRLNRRELVSVRRSGRTAVGEYRVKRPWRRT
jgi:DNA-binding transcriptional ArsR family regulator